MAAVMIGVDPHKASHTAVAINGAEVPLGTVRVRACASQASKLVEWAADWPERTRAIEGAGRARAPSGPATGEISVSVFKFLLGTQTGEFPHGLNMRPCGSIGAVRRLAACCLPARGTAVTAPLIAPLIPQGPAPYGWCEKKEG